MSVAAPVRSLDEYLHELSFVGNAVTSTGPRAGFGKEISYISGIIRNTTQKHDPARAVLSQVRARHVAGNVTSASDVLLNYLVDLLDAGDVTALDGLVRALSASVSSDKDTDLYDDRGLARVHNVLVLTLRAKDYLPGRDALRSAYRVSVSAREGEAAANDAIELL